MHGRDFANLAVDNYLCKLGKKFIVSSQEQTNVLMNTQTRGVADAKHGSTILSALNNKIYYVDQRLSLQLKGIVVRT